MEIFKDVSFGVIIYLSMCSLEDFGKFFAVKYVQNDFILKPLASLISK